MSQLLTTEPPHDRWECESHIYFLPLKYEKLQGVIYVVNMHGYLLCHKGDQLHPFQIKYRYDVMHSNNAALIEGHFLSEMLAITS